MTRERCFGVETSSILSRRVFPPSPAAADIKTIKCLSDVGLWQLCDALRTLTEFIDPRPLYVGEKRKREGARGAMW